MTTTLLDRPAPAADGCEKGEARPCAQVCPASLPRADAPYCGKLGRKSEDCPADQTGCTVC